MHERRVEQLGAWLHDHRRSLTFRFFGVCSLVIAFFLLIAARHLDDIDFGRTLYIALAFLLLSATFNIVVQATAPTPSRGTATPHTRGSERPLPGIVAWGILAPIIAECGMVWFALHNDITLGWIFLAIACVLNVIGLIGVLALRAHQTTPTPADPLPVRSSAPEQLYA